MKNLHTILYAAVLSLVFTACSKNEEHAIANNITLHFNNTFKDKTIVLGDARSATASVNTSAENQEHRFSELKYVISNIRLIKDDGMEFPYYINNLDLGAAVINQADVTSLDYVLSNIPAGNYKQIKFGLGVKAELNTLDQVRFPKFYAAAGANNTEMMWEWGSGYRFTKVEGFYDTDLKTLSIHTGSTVQGKKENLIQGVDAYRDITLDFPASVSIGSKSARMTIIADFDKLLTGKTHTIRLSTGLGDSDNATPNIHNAVQMLKFVDNLGGNGKSDFSGMFSIGSIENY